MLRIPNPISNLQEVINIFKDIFPLLKNIKDFTLDNVSVALIKTNNVTSQGAIGVKALKRSTRADRSLDPIYNQSKALCELYRLLGWIQSTEKQTTFIVTYLGEALVTSKNTQQIIEECLLCNTYPNECIKIKSDAILRPFKTILYHAFRNDYITRDEIIYGVLNLENDRNQQELEQKSKDLVLFRKSKTRLNDELVKISNKDKIKLNPTMYNYTRFPIAAIQWAKFCVKKQNRFYITEQGKNLFIKIKDYQDLRIDNFNKLNNLDKCNLIKYAYYSSLRRFGITTNDKCISESYKYLIDNDIITNKNVLFSPFQQLSYDTIKEYCPELIYKDAVENKQINFNNQSKGFLAVAMQKLEYKIDVANFSDKNNENYEIFQIIKKSLTKKENINKIVESLYNNYSTSNKEVFYPLIADIFCILGFNCKVSRNGQNYERADAIIIDDKYSIPIEIKSPGEETEISVKAVRQALENKIIFLSRNQYHTDNETTSLAIGYNLPNKRSEVYELIEDIYKTYNFNICVLGFKDLLMLIAEVVLTGKKINIEHFRILRGVYHV